MALMDDLMNLHRVDAQVRGLQGRVKAGERFLNAQQRKLDEVQEQKAELESRRRQHQARLGNAESEVAALDERIGKLRAELNQAETNKQYTALLTEVNTLKAQRSERETSQLEEMERIEALSGEIDELAQQATDREKQRNVAQQQLEERRADVKERLEELEAERRDAAARVPNEVLAAFDELAERYDGEAMAPLEMIDRRNREYACAACHMHAPFEKASMLLSSVDTLVRCNACLRILYLQDETRGAMAGKR